MLGLGWAALAWLNVIVVTHAEWDCPHPDFTIKFYYHKAGGKKIAGDVDLAGCKKYCAQRKDCLAVDWNQYTRTCYMHDDVTTTRSLVKSTCCVHCVRSCPKDSTDTSTQATTRQPITTTSGFLQLTTTIPDDGKCPAPLLKLPNSVLEEFVESSTQYEVSNEEECKNILLDTANGTAVDYCIEDGEATCVLHHLIEGLLFIEGRAEGCNHYRKTNCSQPLQCYSHRSRANQILNQTSEHFENIVLSNRSVIPDLELVDCPVGSCFLNQSVIVEQDPLSQNITRFDVEVSRGCDSSLDTSLGKRCSVLTEGTSLNAYCTCHGQRCNSFDYTVFESCVAYYPLDCTARDASRWRRDGVPDDVTFSFLDSKKNWSAVFDGAGSIEVKSFERFQFGELFTVEDDYTLLNAFTAALWLKRTEAGGDMTLLSNGLRDQASVQLWSTSSSPTEHEVHGRVRIDGQFHEVFAEAPLDEWLYVVLRLVPTLNGTSDLEIYLSDFSLESATPEDATNVDFSPGATINIVDSPLTIGKQVEKDSEGNTGDPHYFVGLLDEVWLFNRALTIQELLSIRDTTRPLHAQFF